MLQPDSDASPALLVSSERIRSQRFWIFWLCVLVLGVALRIYLALSERVGYGALGYDDVLYEQLASNLAAGHGLVLDPGGPPTFLRPPGYPAFLAAVHWASGPLASGVQIAQILLWVGLLAMSAYLLSPHGRVAVFASLFLLSFDPLWVISPLTGLSETLSATLVLGALTACVRGERGKTELLWYALAGALLGFAALTRLNLLVAVFPLGFALLLGRGRARAALALCATFAAIFSPWLIRNLAHGYAGLSTVSGVNAAALATHYGLLAPRELDAALGPELDLEHFVPDLTRLEEPGVASLLWEPFQNGRYMSETGLSEIELDRRFAGAARDAFQSHRLEFARACLLNLWNFASSFFERDAGARGVLYRLASLLLLLLACVGVGSKAWREEPALVLGCAGIVLASAVSMAAVTLVYYRYRLPVTPLIALLAALGAQALFDRQTASRHRS